MGVTACEAFRDVDELFINYETNEDEFNTSYGSYNKYCPVKRGSKRCENDYEKLIAISGHAYMELKGNDQTDLDSENDLSVDFLVMGLSHRLYKLSKDHTLSLKDAFGRYFGKNMGGFNHWSILYNKKEFMGFNIGIMNGFYLLFKQICETISISEKPNVQPYEYINGIAQCYIMYNELYNFVNQCDPYIRLLHHLKTIYDEFTKSVIKYNNHDESIRNQIMGLSHIDTTRFRSEFNTAECKKLNKKLAKTTPKIIKIGIQMLKDEEKRNNGGESQSTEDEDDEDFDLDEEEDDENLDLDDDDDDDLGNNDDTTENPLNPIQNNPQGTPPVPEPGPQQQPSAQSISTTASPGITPPAGTTPSTDMQNGVVNNPNGDPNSQPTNQGDKQVNQNGDSANPDTSQGGSGGGSGGESSGSGSGGSDSGPSGDPGGGKNSGGGDPGSGANDGSSGGPKAPGDPAATDSSGGSNGYWLSNWEDRFNPLNYLPNVSDIYESSKSILTNTANQVSNAYTNTVGIVKGAYDSTMISITGAYNNAMTSITGAYNNAMTSITDAYDRTTNYIGNAVNSVTSQLNPFSTSHSDDNQSGSNSLGGGTDTSNHSQQNPKQPVNPPPPPSLPPSPSSSPPSTPQSTSQPTPHPIPQPTPQLSQAPPSPQPQDPPQTPSPSQQHSNQAQDKLQITVQNGTSNTLQQPDPNTGKGVQTMTITKATLSSSSTDPSITGSGITTGIVVKMSEKSSIWCIGSNKKCDVLSIGIISISIFAFLTIMYKYLSFGSAKNSKKKKSMKRVIKYGDGTRKTQIIIKSYDRNKQLKPIINPVGRKKDPTLNIYKLMQADPVPFINLFFLLIFFVYKKKLNYLEL
ncbi:PIR protein CIR protein [Plasmodium vinckei petteri]|uniref:PIR protein CIR protein n=1 Tax=Plasmodium vinckei petteri TaxID=138298 RepID=A0A6V7SCX7_PLAVN|nr:PIR protein CIR protein [Plasmodium vinckei petteri]